MQKGFPYYGMGPKNMAVETVAIERQLRERERRLSPAGRLERYVAVRISYFWPRQSITLVGMVALWALLSPFWAITAGAIIIAAEAIDCLYLRTFSWRIAHGENVNRLAILSALTAIIPAAAFAFTPIIAWWMAPEQIAKTFSIAYLMGISANACTVVHLHRRATLMRLFVYGGTLVGILFVEFTMHNHSFAQSLGDIMAVFIFLYLVLMSSKYIVEARQRENRNITAHLEQSLLLARANKNLEEQQREARNLALVAKHAHDNVIMSDPEGKILWVNETFVQETGFSRDEAIGATPAQILSGPDTSMDTQDGIVAAIKAGKSHRAEIINYSKSGKRIWIETNLVPVLDGEGNVELIIAVERNITAAKSHESDLAAAMIAAEDAGRAKAQFLATMSHEIRTPMNGIIGMADLLSETKLTRSNRQFVETIRTSAEALLTIINDILDFSKLDAGKLAVHKAEFNLSNCIEGAVTLLRPQATDKRLYVDVVCTQPLPQTVFGDDGRLRQILINIVGNAIKFTATGGVTVSVECGSFDETYKLRIDVRDTGIGIASDRLEHVFDQFAQADTATTRQFGGTGLGLSISQLIAQEMGGGISVTSAPGEGSCFTIEIELETMPKSHVAKDNTAETPTLDVLENRVVLVAEDNRTNRLLVRNFLKDVPLTLLFAKNGEQAVNMTRAHEPDIVLMDMSMPIMDGLEATQAIRAEAMEQPHIIALTANVFASDKAACLNAGMDGFLAKPLRKLQLLETLARVPIADAANDMVPKKPQV